MKGIDHQNGIKNNWTALLSSQSSLEYFQSVLESAPMCWSKVVLCVYSCPVAKRASESVSKGYTFFQRHLKKYCREPPIIYMTCLLLHSQVFFLFRRDLTWILCSTSVSIFKVQFIFLTRLNSKMFNFWCDLILC